VEPVVPKEARLEAGWVLEPSTAAPAVEAAPAAAPDGTVWLVLDGQTVSVPERNVLLAADRPFQQLAWLGGKPLARSYQALGALAAGPKGGAGVPRARFIPAATVPLTSWRMATAGDSVFVAGFNPRKRVFQVALLGPAAGDGPLKVLYETDARIADVATDGRSAYFASGPAIWKIGADGSAAVFRAHPSLTLRQLAAAPGGGFFYLTDRTVGYAGRSATFDFLRCGDCRIAAANDDLFVLLGGLRGGLLRLRGVGSLAGVTLGGAR
jgi:hypothetical protein